MCGIAGIVAWEGLRPDERAGLPTMLERLAHRGPDGSGTFASPQCVLGHRRLSIIDLEGGGQPIANEDGTIQLVCNGEIFNHRELRDRLMEQGHRFRGGSDCEVIVHLYEERGDDCVEMLRGMFAFALWDQTRGRLLLVRDRLGVKPLYYTVDHRRLAFASDLGALRVVEPALEIDPRAVADYFTFGFIASPRTIHQRIAKFGPGERGVYENGRLARHGYWTLRHTGYFDLTEPALMHALSGAFEAATRLRLDADVPIGALLSGGVDSAAVMNMARRASDDVPPAFTIGFDDANCDERESAVQTARLVGARHEVTEATLEAGAGLAEVTRYFDEPFAGASALPMLQLARFARQRVKVALSGDGGDEIFAGYRRYRFDLWEQRVRRMAPGLLRRPLFSGLAGLAPSGPRWPRWMRGAATLRNLATDAATAHARSIARMMPDAARALLTPDVRSALRDYDPFDRPRALYVECDAPHSLSRCQYVDIRFELADGILTKVDRAGMAHGLEIRSPLLDARLAEFAWRIPPGMRIRGRQGKYLLRRIVSSQLDPGVAARKKHGFDVPLDAWFRGPLRETFENEILNQCGAVHEWLDAPAVRQHWQEHQSERRNNGPTLWAMLVFARWLENARRPVSAVHEPISNPLSIEKPAPVVAVI